MNLGQEIELATWCNAFSFVSESFIVHFKDIWPLVSASLFSPLQILRLKHLQKHSELCLCWKMHKTASKSTSSSNEIVFFPFFNSFPDFRISFNIFLGQASSTKFGITLSCSTILEGFSFCKFESSISS